MTIDNVFDFIDALELTGYVPGTANENRLFVFNTLPLGADVTDNPLELISAYEAIGVNIPENVFSSIVDLVTSGRAQSNAVSIFAPTSLIPESAATQYTGSLTDGNYIVYSDVQIYNSITEESYIKTFYYKFDDLSTPAEISQNIRNFINLSAQDNGIDSLKGLQASNVKLLRLYHA